MERTTELIKDLFINRNDVHAEGFLAGITGRMAYAKKDNALTDKIIHEHIEGKKTIGIYQLDEKKLKWGCFDFDENTIEDFERAKKLYRYLIDKGYHPLMENSGGGQYKTHIWIFADSDAASMRHFMENICNECLVKAHEIFPKQTSIDEGGYGNLVKLPLALHLQSGKRSFFYNDDIEPEMDYKKILEYHAAHKDAIQQVVVVKEVKKIETKNDNPDACAFLDFALTHELPVGKRHELISRNMAYYIHDKPDKEILKEEYVKIQKHPPQDLDNWLKGIEKGKAVPLNCGELITYQREHKIPLKCRGCQRFKDYVKEQKLKQELKKQVEIEMSNKSAQEEGFLADTLNSLFTDFLAIGNEFVKKVPIYYDEAHNWWVWQTKENCYALKDETDLLNEVDRRVKNPNVNSKVKNEILEALKRVGRGMRPRDFNRDWVQFRNKVINYKTEEEFEASPTFFATNPLPWNLGEHEDCPTIDKLFSEWVGDENKLVLYQCLAYCMLSDYPLHRIFCLIGSGSNGKGTFLRLVEKFIGLKNVSSTELDNLIKSRFECARLYKKLVCVMGETNFAELSQTSIIKKLTGQDLIGYEFKNKNPFEEYNYAKIVISTNNLPPTTDKTSGFYRRWLIVDFPHTFQKEVDLLSLIPEEEFENLGRKCIRILRELMEERQFHNEGSIDDRAKRYEEKSNPLNKFLSEFTEQDLDGHITTNDFYKKFNQWLKEKGFREMSDQTISSQLTLQGYEKGKKYFNWLFDGKGGQLRVWYGLKWKGERNDEE